MTKLDFMDDDCDIQGFPIQYLNDDDFDALRFFESIRYLNSLIVRFYYRLPCDYDIRREMLLVLNTIYQQSEITHSTFHRYCSLINRISLSRVLLKNKLFYLSVR